MFMAFLHLHAQPLKVVAERSRGKLRGWRGAWCRGYFIIYTAADSDSGIVVPAGTADVGQPVD